MDGNGTRLQNIPLPLDPAAVMRHLGKSGGKSSELVRASVEHWRLAARDLLAPQAIYRSFAVEEIAGGVVSLAGGQRFSGSRLGTLFAGAEQLVVTVGTIGRALEEEVSPGARTLFLG